MAEHPAMGVEGEAPCPPAAVEPETVALDEGTALTLGAKTHVLDLHERRDRERIIGREQVDVARGEPRHRERPRRGKALRGGGERRSLRETDALDRSSIADPFDDGRALGKIGGPLRRHHDEGRRAVRDQAAILEPERIDEGLAREIFVERQRPAVHDRGRIAAGVAAAGDRDRAQLVAAGPELVHVAPRDLRIIDRLRDEAEDRLGVRLDCMLAVVVGRSSRPAPRLARPVDSEDADDRPRFASAHGGISGARRRRGLRERPAVAREPDVLRYAIVAPESRRVDLAAETAGDHDPVDVARRKEGIGKRRVDRREAHRLRVARRGPGHRGFADPDDCDLSLDIRKLGRARIDATYAAHIAIDETLLPNAQRILELICAPRPV